MCYNVVDRTSAIRNHPWITCQKHKPSKSTTREKATFTYEVWDVWSHPCPWNWVAIGHAVTEYVRAAHALGAGIKRHHCSSWIGQIFYPYASVVYTWSDNLAHISSNIIINWKIFEEGLLNQTGAASLHQIFLKILLCNQDIFICVRPLQMWMGWWNSCQLWQPVWYSGLSLYSKI